MSVCVSCSSLSCSRSLSNFSGECHPHHIACLPLCLIACRIRGSPAYQSKPVACVERSPQRTFGLQWFVCHAQDFLELYVWPYMEASASLLAHDSYHCSSYPHTTAFPTRRKGPWDMAARIIDVGNDAEEKGLDAAWVPSASQQCPALCRPPDHQDWLAC